MKDQLKLSNALLNAFERANTGNEKWAVLNRSQQILERAQKRAMRIRPENNPSKIRAIGNNQLLYFSMRTTAQRLRNSLSTPKVTSLF